MTHPEFLTKIDWKLLREQKHAIMYAAADTIDDHYREHLDGVVALIDVIQDYACDEMGISEKEIFNLNPEEE